MSEINMMKYKGYYGSVNFDVDNELFYGKVEFIRDLVNYEACDAKSLIKSFHDAVDGYLKDCSELEKNPDIPFKGSFNVRITPELHRDISLYALHNHSTLNKVVKSALKEFMEVHS